jgi:xanthine dehydrogenase accessory factor
MEQQLDLFCARFSELHQSRTPMVVVTMTDCRGSAPQNVGARMIVGVDQILFGTVGGGKIEAHCLKIAREYLQNPKDFQPRSFTWNLQRDILMSCGGEVTMFFELYSPQSAWKLAVFGAGHVSQELTRILVKLDCELTVIDARAEWLSLLPPETPRFKKIQTDSMASVIDTLDPQTFVCLMTMGHSFDLPILKRALELNHFPFLGVIGSQAKRNRLEKELREQGYPGEMNFYCPLGEDFGSNAPMEIALSMTAQLLKERDKKAIHA